MFAEPLPALPASDRFRYRGSTHPVTSLGRKATTDSKVQRAITSTAQMIVSPYLFCSIGMRPPRLIITCHTFRRATATCILAKDPRTQAGKRGSGA